MCVEGNDAVWVGEGDGWEGRDVCGGEVFTGGECGGGDALLSEDGLCERDPGFGGLVGRDWAERNGTGLGLVLGRKGVWLNRWTERQTIMLVRRIGR